MVLDGRPVRTPAKAALILPTMQMARAVAAEWDAQEKTVDPATMPVTRAANSAIDKTLPQQAEVVKLVAEYGGSDLLCYRAEGPEELLTRQKTAWDPLLDWAATEFDAPLRCAVGVMHVAQPAKSIANLSTRVQATTAYELTALHDLVALSGSLVIGLAAINKYKKLKDLWEFSRVDENWQTEQWGRDQEAESAAAKKRRAFLDAGKFFDLCQP